MNCLCGRCDACQVCSPDRYRKAELKAYTKATAILTDFLIDPFENAELRAAIVKAIMDEFH